MNLNSISFSPFALGTIIIDRRNLVSLSHLYKYLKPHLVGLFFIYCFILDLHLSLDKCWSTLWNRLFDALSANALFRCSITRGILYELSVLSSLLLLEKKRFCYIPKKCLYFILHCFKVVNFLCSVSIPFRYNDL